MRKQTSGSVIIIEIKVPCGGTLISILGDNDRHSILG